MTTTTTEPTKVPTRQEVTRMLAELDALEGLGIFRERRDEIKPVLRRRGELTPNRVQRLVRNLYVADQK